MLCDAYVFRHCWASLTPASTDQPALVWVSQSYQVYELNLWPTSTYPQ
jgi:hypothetical protein